MAAPNPSAAEGGRIESAQNRGIRIDQFRAMALTNREGADVVHDAYAADNPDAVVAPSTEATAEWGEPTFVIGYDRVQLLVDHTPGTSTSGVEVVAQVADMGNGSANPGTFRDLYEREAGGTTVQWRASIATTVAAALAFSGDLHASKWIRFKVWVPGSDNTGARVKLSAIFSKNAL